jgi:hypothetical protein
MSLFSRSKSEAVERRPFGSCCADLQRAMNHDATHLLRVEDNGVLYLSVGVAQTEEGLGWLDQAVLFCPFCGAALQSRDEIARAPRL